MDQRFGDAASIVYYDVKDAEVRQSRGTVIDEIETRGLLYPVTVVDGVPLYDGAVSYPAILRAVSNKLTQAPS
jgi:disulfide oxidoreductase YuzD